MSGCITLCFGRSKEGAFVDKDSSLNTYIYIYPQKYLSITVKFHNKDPGHENSTYPIGLTSGFA